MTEPRRPTPVGLPLAVWEREGLAAALAKAGLAAADVKSDGPLFWRFENDDVPVGFGGLEIFGDQALLRSVLTLPPVRNRGIGSNIVASLELEARVRGCRVVWLMTEKAADFFARLGYRVREQDEIPNTIRDASPFTSAGAALCMAKRMD